ncbi:spondin domain-containing protein [Roseivirga sp. BDSF3-8]|uniref:spondin domain-containing protein n=1 Tax=Roseivirga sp. BDSF3-8 TaxID=3241598 RepID=UPI003531AE83
MKRYFLITALSLGMLACDDDDDSGMIPGNAEETEFRVTITNIGTAFPIFQSGIFDTPVGESAAGPATPGQLYSFEFYATPGMYLSFATMLVQTNDIFIAPESDTGIPLFDNGTPIEGDITSLFTFWDAGTEVNEEPGSGPNQAPRQNGPDTGIDENGVVAELSAVNDGFTYPSIEGVVTISLQAVDDGSNMFVLTIENISGNSTLPGPVSPGAYAIHSPAVQLFTTGEPASEGLEDIAEDGNPAALGDFTRANTGLVTPFSPGVYVVYNSSATPLFEEGQTDQGNGLEAIAEDGNPAMLAMALGTNNDVSSYGVFNTPVSASSPGPVFAGQSYSFTIMASPGDRLNLATMLIQSNDLFIAYGEGGLPLFNGSSPAEGDVTPGFRIWDAGTEVNEFPGAGPNQAPRQSGPDTGTIESEPIEEVNDGFTYPGASDLITITVRVI